MLFRSTFKVRNSNVFVSATFKLKATKPDDPAGKVDIEATTTEDGSVIVTIKNMKSDKWYSIRTASTEGIDKDAVILRFEGKLADSNNTLSFQTKPDHKVFWVAETSRTPELGKPDKPDEINNPFNEDFDKGNWAFDEYTISGTEAN